MRKYFLTCAVAMLAASNVNATTDYAEVTAKATIEVAGTISCTDLDFGTIVVKQNNGISSVTKRYDEGVEIVGDVISTTIKGNDNLAFCEIPEGAKLSHDKTAILTNETGATMEITEIGVGVDTETTHAFDGKLNIPANVASGVYTGTFTVTHTY